jgi:beta-galactosidase
MLIGAAYYPEHWPKERWPEDARLMEEAGLGVVRLAEFAWHRLEPEEGRYDFAWLDEVMEVLAARGIRVVMCTPSATPTARHIARWPDLLPVLEDGRRYPFGIRRHYCFRHEGYRDACRRMADAMARHFGRNKQVLGWQIDNEFGGIDFGAACYCERCVAAWQTWLRQRYGTLEALNDAWGTAFWAQEYSGWTRSSPPLNPSSIRTRRSISTGGGSRARGSWSFSRRRSTPSGRMSGASGSRRTSWAFSRNSTTTPSRRPWTSWAGTAIPFYSIPILM